MERFKTFEEFWPFYLGEHSAPLTRKIHAIGTTSAVVLAGVGLLTGRLSLILAAPIAGYAPAWFSHFVIEGNKPASFQYPLWSLRADFLMAWMMYKGELDAELGRLGVAQDKPNGRDTSAKSLA